MNPILFGAAFGTLVFGGATLSRFDRSAERDIREKLTGDHVVVKVRAHIGFESLWGKFPSVEVDASNFTCASLPFHMDSKGSKYAEFRHMRVNLQNFTLKRLHIESLTADIRHTHFDLGYATKYRHVRITKSGVGPLTITLSLDDVKAYAMKKYPQIKELEIVPTADGIKMNGTGNFGLFTAKFSLTGQPGVTAGTQLILLNPAMTMNGKPMEAKQQELFLKPFTPVLDLDRDLGAEGGIQLDRVFMKGDRIIATGIGKIPESR